MGPEYSKSSKHGRVLGIEETQGLLMSLCIFGFHKSHFYPSLKALGSLILSFKNHS